MKRLLVVFALLFSCLTPSYADEIKAEIGDATVTLSDVPCDSKAVLDNVKDEYRSEFQNGSAAFADHSVKFCWMLVPSEGAVFIMDESGNYGAIPLQAFMQRKDEGI